MEQKKKARHNFIAAAIIVLVLVSVTGFLFDYYFDLNDDVLMKDILSGAYTGQPEENNIQMLFPISFLLSILYRIFPGADVYGIFLLACQFGSLLLILWRSLELLEQKKLLEKKLQPGDKKTVARIPMLSKLLILLLLVVILVPLLPHLVFVQYTVTVGMLAAAAGFLILTGESGRDKWISKGDFWAILMLFLAYLIRSEMLLLMLPLAGCGVILRYFREVRIAGQEPVEDHEVIGFKGTPKAITLHYVYAILFLGVLLLVGNGAHRLANSSSEWSEFVRFFDNRTEVYDFQGIPEYEENKEFYDSIGLSEQEQGLLSNYNFGLDDEINADVMGEIAGYAASRHEEETPFIQKVKTGLGYYFYRLHHLGTLQEYTYPQTDAPWNLIVFCLYLIIFCIYVFGKNQRDENPRIFQEHTREKVETRVAKDDLQKAPRGRLHQICRGIAGILLIFGVRTALWLYIIVRGRDPIRITHSLYWMEIAVLGGWILVCLCKDRILQESGTGIALRAILVCLAVLLCIGTLAYLPQEVRVIRNEEVQRQEINDPYQQLYSYCKEHPDNFYFIDVYSSVSYSEKLFEKVDNSRQNSMIMGGWASKSPLEKKKLQQQGYENMEQGLLSENAFFIQRSEESAAWLKEYYASEGIDVAVTPLEVIQEEFTVYAVEEQ